jgi:hypothetical protein
VQLMGKNPSDSALSASSRVQKLAKVGGLSLPDVVRVLSKDSTVLKWDPAEFLYEVINGPKFESRSKLLFVAISCLKLFYLPDFDRQIAGSILCEKFDVN